MKAAALLALLVCSPAFAATPPREFNVFVGHAQSLKNWHGQAHFRSITFELLANERLVNRLLPTARVGIDATYSDVRQPRSWFNDTADIDSIRAEWLQFFIRQYWLRDSPAVRPFIDLGTGPMWSNRRIPQATSHINFNSQAGLGVELFPTARLPLYVGYRFSHISNGGLAERNPGWNINGFFIGTRLK